MTTEAGSETGDGARSGIETARLRALVASLGLGVLVEDEDRKVSLANEVFCAMFHIPVSPTALVGADCAAAAEQVASLLLKPEEFRARIAEVLAQAAPATGDEIQFRDGRVLERDYVPIAVDSVGRGHLWVYRDVTRVRQDAELQRAAEVRDQLRLAVDTIPGLVFSARLDGFVDFFNKRWCDYTGLTLEQASGWGWEAVVFPDDLPELRARWKSILASARPGEIEARLRRADGTYRWFSSQIVPLHDERGELAKWYGQSTDIDDRKRAEALLAGEKRLLEMLAHGGSFTTVLETLCRLVEDNADACWCGITIVSPTGTKLEHGAAPSLPESYSQGIHGRPINALAGPCGMAAALKTQVIVSDVASDTRWERDGWTALASDHGLKSCWSTPILSREEKVLGTFALYQATPGTPSARQLDLIEQFTHLASIVIERKRSEDALQNAQAELSHVTRVTTLGEIAASIAHEINQPLAAIVADATACLNWLRGDHTSLERVRESLAAIVADGTRAGEILTRIRSLLRRSATARVRCDLRAVVSGAVELIRPQFGRQDFALDVSLGNDALPILGDPVELQQVVLNLLLNAGEALKEVRPERRRVVVRASLQSQDDRSCALVSVEDAGVGITESDADRLFAPFHTTKPGGLGMGLSITRSIIERHGGRVWARANAEHGATFTVELPRFSEQE